MTAVAIVGMAVMLPGAGDLDTYHRNLVRGVDAITDVPGHRWSEQFYRPDSAGAADEIYCRRGGFVDELAEVEITRLGLMPAALPGTEPDQLIALHVATGAVADAGGLQQLGAGERVGVILGRGSYLTPGLARLDQRVRTSNQLITTLRELCPGLGEERLSQVRAAFVASLGPDAPEAALGLVPNLAASRIANRLDLHGPAYTVDAACASSLVAVDHAVRELAGGRCDAVLAGGVHHCHDITFWSVFSQLRALSTGQQIRPFDRRADGLLIGEGTGVVVLKRLADAERAGDRVYAVIRGTGVSSDGRGASLVNPRPEGQVLALRRAWDAAGLDPARPGSLGLLEAHGTGTPAGDLAELATLREVFGGPGPQRRAVIGSVKSMIGHTMPAAGIAGLVKAALAVHHQELLPTLYCEEPRDELGQTRFRPLAAAQPWELGGGQTVRRAAVNAFGFGGVNAHLVLEQHPAPGRVRPPRPAAEGPGQQRAAVREAGRVLLMVADGPAELARRLSATDSEVIASADLPDARRVAREHPDWCRLGIVEPTPKRLALARKVVARPAGWRGRGEVWFSLRPLTGGGAGHLAFVFPGLEAEFSPRVDDVARWLGTPPPELPSDTLARHGGSVLAVGRLLDAALRRLGVVPAGVAGHSVGEWVAMISGGLVRGEDVDALVSGRSFEQLQVPGVEFASLGCGLRQVAEAIGDRRELVVSHENSTQQTVVCGPAAAVQDLVRQMRSGNVIARLLPFRSGFHTPMLEPYLPPFRAAAQQLTVGRASTPVWSATTGGIFPAEPDAVRELYLRHLLEPVRFRSLVLAMHEAGARVFVQVGPGQLGSLVDDTLREAEHLTVAANSSTRPGLEQLLRVLTAVWVEGGDPAIEPLLAALSAPSAGVAAPAVKAAPAGRGTRVRLDLGSSLVSLSGGPAPFLSAAAVLAPAAAAGSGLDPTAALHRLGDRLPEARELSDLMHLTAETAVALLSQRPGGPVPPAATETTLRVSTATMPYLLDHCFAPQRDGWPDEPDRRPVVPATTMVQQMAEAAQAAAGGRPVIGLDDVRFTRWLVASPPVDVAVTVHPTGPGRLAVSLTGHATATVLLDDRYPRDAPPAWPAQPGERRPSLTPARLYGERWMFHGPRFQGISELTAVSADGIRGVITAPQAPGGLLDNVGQLLGAWIVETLPARQIAFPVRIRQLRFFGPLPAAGEAVSCALRIRHLSESDIEFDAQLSVAGVVLASVTGWQDQRFDCDQHTSPAYRFPERHLLSSRQPGGWFLTPERWPALAARDLYLRKYLNTAEREEYARCSPRRQRHWLLGRIAVKDAVRSWLWEHGQGPVFPAEVLVRNDPAGRPEVSGQHGLRLPALQVSLAHCRELAVALARPGSSGPGGPGVGIDVEEIEQRAEATVRFALAPAEIELLAQVVAETGESLPECFTRFWAAKEAAAKAEGTGLQGSPRAFAVRGVSAEVIDVEAWTGTTQARRHRVRTAVVQNPPGLPQRRYAVAWTDRINHRAGEELS